MDFTNVMLMSALVVLFTAQSLLLKLYTPKYPGREELASPAFTVVFSFAISIITFLLTFFSFSDAGLAIGYNFSLSWQTVLLGGLDALAIIGYNASIIRGSKTGPFSVLMIFSIAGSIIIPTVVSAFFFDEVPSIGKVISMLVVIASVYLVSKKSGETYSDKKVFWISCFIFAAASGISSALIKIHEQIMTKNQGYPAEQKEFVVIAYLFAAVFSVIMLLFKEGRAFPKAMVQTKASFLYLAICSVVGVGAINLLFYTVPLIEAAVLYTLKDASVFLLSTAISCIFFKERLTRLNAVGCVTMCAALVGVSFL